MPEDEKNIDFEVALRSVDEEWYSKAKIQASRKDMLGEFVGTELFLIDGDSLVQTVLDDPLLALGHAEELDFQILHAYFAFERTLANFTDRGSNFEIVFFDNNRHLTIQSGIAGPLRESSRSFVRNALIGHAKRLFPSTSIYSSLFDPRWAEYRRIKKPMLIVCNDGGADIPSTKAELALLQRAFVYDVMTKYGLRVAILDSIDWQDSKIVCPMYSPPRLEQLNKSVDHLLSIWRPQAQRRLDAIHERLSDSPTPTDVATWLTAAGRSFLQKSGKYDPLRRPVLQAFVAHMLLLSSLEVKERAIKPRGIDPQLSTYINDSFYPALLPSLELGLHNAPFRPDMDGRIFGHMLHAIIEGGDLGKLLGPTLNEQFSFLWDSINLGGEEATPLSAHFAPVKLSASRTQIVRASGPSVLPLSTVLDESFAIIEAHDEREEPLGTIPKVANSMLLRPAQIWHEGKTTTPLHHIGTQAPKQLTGKLRTRKLKKDQRDMARLQRQAATLTGAKGARLQQQVIPPVGSSKARPTREKPAASSKSGAKKGGKAAEPKLSSADKTRLKIKQEKDGKVQSETEIWWRAQLSDLSKLSAPAQIARLDGLTRNKKADEEWLAAEMAMYRLHLECTKWIEDPSREDRAVADRYRVVLLTQVKEISSMAGLTTTIRTTLNSILSALGFEKIKVPSSASSDVTNRSYQFKFAKVVSKTKGTAAYSFFPIQEHPTEFQLRLFGEYMDRSMDSAPDPRTQFEPDAWQREVLDKIDRDESMLVIAPTSAGKTFIGFYAMEKVLRDSDSGLLIYVAPSKALVSQIAAEVYARFKKDLNGKSCWAVNTRELQLHNPVETQILITLPETLSNMFFTPALAKAWMPRIRRIIFDEIHSISSDEGGAVWEQLIIMAPCPIIGLSATVGNPSEFNNWLGSIQKMHGYPHSLVLHPHRYSHLRKFIWNVHTALPTFSGLEKTPSESRLTFLHPLAALRFRMQDITSDLPLESRDCLSLFQAMRACAGPEEKDALAGLEPVTFFQSQSTQLLRQKDIVQYEAALKAKLTSWVSAPGGATDSVAQHVITHLSKDIQPIGQTIQSTPNYFLTRDERSEQLIHLLVDLHQQDDLPAIVFSFDRHYLETLADQLLVTLEKAEDTYRDSSPEWKLKLKEWERWQQGSKGREKEAARGSKKSSRKNKDEDDDAVAEDVSNKAVPPNLTDPDDPSPEFSFASFKSYTKEELKEDLREMAWQKISPRLLDCLKRGIAVHHSGLPKGYRSLVEGLFRLGYIRVMISSETLALGINAPARTTVFLDGAGLTPLMFRQCSGRAGRRGFDLLGKVVFFGMPLESVQRLLLSRLSPLTGRYPLSTTVSLRLTNLLDGSDNAPAALLAARSFVTIPHLSVSSDTGREETVHHLRFSLDYLRHSKLLDQTGKTLLLSDLAGPLHESEPGNLAFISLLRSGYLHELCAGIETSRLKTTREFVLVLSHIFCRRFLRKISGGEIRELVRTSASVVLLPPLPPKALKVLKQHNEDVLYVFTNYTLAYASKNQEALSPDTSLPLSGKVEVVSRNEAVPFVEQLLEFQVPVVGRSVFVANSGHGDNFESIEDLARTTRPGLHLNKSAIPYIEIVSDHEKYSLNAALYDFFIHGSDDVLVAANAIRRGEVWYLLNDFFLVLVALQTSFEQLFQQGIKDTAGVDLDGTEGYAPPALDDEAEDREEYFKDRETIQGVSEAFPQRPSAVPEGDWDIYRTVVAVRNEFETKFKAMWA